jgi:membrane protein
MLVIVIAVAGLIWQRDAVQGAVMNQIGGLVGVQGAEFVSGLLEGAGNPREGIAATIIGIITLLFGALGVFNALHDS